MKCVFSGTVKKVDYESWYQADDWFGRIFGLTVPWGRLTVETENELFVFQERYYLPDLDMVTVGEPINITYEADGDDWMLRWRRKEKRNDTTDGRS